ncbi:rhodanese-like domain-containing protein [Bacillus sp. RG28]|uniref:Rhodanese-like domain-containing protein n=1 Tax=Gottfriedia endophytica TaxID=2820819 RepID=A0A940NJB3_9BACI|nr:rhodanese-like domain-containing protein [Gottfriedia endophytica]MBP0725172.1 rhodanese-like domain-containing protein [Gottfriedia endophytica]
MKEITAVDLEKLLDEGKTVNLIDVRETDEVATGKIPGAINIPLGLIEFRLQDLDKSKEYVLVCRSGGRSGRATEFLESRGFHVMNVTGGMLSWNGDIE